MRTLRSAIVSLSIFPVGCAKEPSPSSTSPGSGTATPAGVSTIRASAATASGAEPGPGSPPLGSPDFCPGDDGTAIPLASSSFASELAAGALRGELEATNSICGDTWCEGSFEWFFYDLRSGGGRSEITMRAYAVHRSPEGADARKVVVETDRYVERVLSQHVVPSCTTPCRGWKTPPRWEPCLVLDLRCELAEPWTAPEIGRSWEKAFIDCGIALETAVRKIHPEF